MNMLSRSVISKWLMLFALVILVTTGATFAKRSLRSKPVRFLEVSPPSREINANEGEKSITTSYRIQNVGDRPVKLGDPSTTCGCSVASISQKLIVPGSFAEIQVKGEPPLVGRKRVEIRMPTDSTDLPEVVLELIMVGPGKTPYVAFDSKAVNFGSLSRNDLPVKKEVMIMTRETVGRTPWISRLESTVDGLSFEGGPTEESDLGNRVLARTYRYRAILSQKTKAASLDGTLRVFGNDRSASILELPILGRFHEAVLASPSVLYSSYAPSEKLEPLKVVISCNGSDFNANAVEPEEVPPSVRVRRVSNSKQSTIFEVEWEKSVSDDLRATLTFRTGVSESPKISVPLLLHRTTAVEKSTESVQVSKPG